MWCNISGSRREGGPNLSHNLPRHISSLGWCHWPRRTTGLLTGSTLALAIVTRLTGSTLALSIVVTISSAVVGVSSIVGAPSFAHRLYCIKITTQKTQVDEL
ncbi:hypothetical protein P3X46_028522 [Hevea brasiliensis]|uniref:Uncharacterized protein n=1 Tax=Hevea brasiliensis TaxID=3981 RepID=A0ABQ9KQI4_HEVBR|nr:hypothetical protein P3X46_028522 [Hevea brasiliensis]